MWKELGLVLSLNQMIEAVRTTLLRGQHTRTHDHHGTWNGFVSAALQGSSCTTPRLFEDKHCKARHQDQRVSYLAGHSRQQRKLTLLHLHIHVRAPI